MSMSSLSFILSKLLGSSVEYIASSSVEGRSGQSELCNAALALTHTLSDIEKRDRAATSKDSEENRSLELNSVPFVLEYGINIHL